MLFNASVPEKALLVCIGKFIIALIVQQFSNSVSLLFLRRIKGRNCGSTQHLGSFYSCQQSEHSTSSDLKGGKGVTKLLDYLCRGLVPRLMIYVTQGALFFASYEFIKHVLAVDVPRLRIKSSHAGDLSRGQAPLPAESS